MHESKKQNKNINKNYIQIDEIKFDSNDKFEIRLKRNYFKIE